MPYLCGVKSKEILVMKTLIINMHTRRKEIDFKSCLADNIKSYVKKNYPNGVIFTLPIMFFNLYNNSQAYIKKIFINYDYDELFVTYRNMIENEDSTRELCHAPIELCVPLYKILQSEDKIKEHNLIEDSENK